MINIHTPVPSGKYTPAVKVNGLIFTAGMTPRNNGKLILTGKVTMAQPIEFYKEAVQQAVSNCYMAAKSALAENEKIDRAVEMTVMLNAEPDYLYHSKVADFASEYLSELLGEKGICARAAIGLGSLPGEAPLEIQMIFSYI